MSTMNAKTASELTPGTLVTVPFGYNRTPRTVPVVSAGPLETWGRGMRPAGATPETPLCIVRVDLGGRVGERNYGNELVELVEE